MEAARAVAQRSVLIVGSERGKAFVGPNSAMFSAYVAPAELRLFEWETGRLMIGIAAGEKQNVFAIWRRLGSFPFAAALLCVEYHAVPGERSKTQSEGSADVGSLAGQPVREFPRIAGC